MDLGKSGKLPKIFTADELQWLRDYMNEYGEMKSKNVYRKHLSNFHDNWETVNEFLKSKFHPVIGDDFKFCYALSNTGLKQDNEIHTDICLRHTTLPAGFKLPNDDSEHVYYTFLVIEDYDRVQTDHKPRTYLFENEHRHLENTAPDFIDTNDIDLSLPTHEVDEIVKRDLEHLPSELVSRLKISAVIDQEPLSVNYWQSYIYHVQDSFINRGVRWKKFFNIMACKKI
jgi:hypothetical protein